MYSFSVLSSAPTLPSFSCQHQLYKFAITGKSSSSIPKQIWLHALIWVWLFLTLGQIDSKKTMNQTDFSIVWFFSSPMSTWPVHHHYIEWSSLAPEGVLQKENICTLFWPNNYKQRNQWSTQTSGKSCRSPVQSPKWVPHSRC